MKVTVCAPAKINLTLNIEGRREDGYHLLSSVFQSVSLSDRVDIEEIDESGIVLTLSDPLLPCDRRNTAYRAAELFFEKTAIAPAVHIHVTKLIPQQAGLGGGSADAAGVLVGLNNLYGSPLDLRELCVLGEKVGADVPFCIIGGTAMVTGIGEIIERLPNLPLCRVVIAKPDVGVSTTAAYAAVDSVQTIPADQSAMRTAIDNGDLRSIGVLLSNAFEQALELPQIQLILETMRGFSPLGCMMSGSGSAVYALFDVDDEENISACVNALSQTVEVHCCAPISHGPLVMY